MKLLVVLFLLGLALSSAVPVPSHELDLESAEELQEFVELVLKADNDEEPTEVAKKLREQLDEVLEKIKDAVDKGKAVKEDVIQKLKEVREKMKEARVELGKKGRELLDKIKEKAKDYWKKILDRLNPDKRSMMIERDIKDRLQEAYDKLLEFIKNMVENGNGVNDRYLDKMRDLREKLKDRMGNLDQKLRDTYEKISDEYKDVFKKIMDRLGVEKRAVQFQAEDDETTELGKKLREQLGEILEKIKDAVDKGKVLKEDVIRKLKEVREKMKEARVELGKKGKELQEKIMEKAKDYWKKILDRLNPDKISVMVERSIKDRLQETFDKLLNIMKDSIENGNPVNDRILEKFRELREKLKDRTGILDRKVKEIYERISDKNKGAFRKIMDKLGIQKRKIELYVEDDTTTAEVEKSLREHLDELLERIKDAVDHGKTVKEEYLRRLKELRQKLKDMGADLGQKARELLKKIRESGRDYFKKILEKLGLGKRFADEYEERFLYEFEDEPEDDNQLGEKFDELLAKIKDVLESGKGNFKEHMAKLKELRQKLRERPINLSENAKEFLEILKKFDAKRSIDIRENLRKLKEKILEGFDSEKIKEKITDLFGRGNDIAKKLFKKLEDKNENARQKILDFIDKLVEKQEDFKYVYERVKNYLKNVKITLKEKFLKFGEWAVAQYEKGLEKGKDEAESIKNLAREFINNAKTMSREVRDQAKDFFHEYKDDLGIIYEDLVKKVKELSN